MTDRPTGPATAAGEAMLRDPRAWWVERRVLTDMILAIEAEAATAPALDVNRLIRAVQLSRNHDRDPSHQNALCACGMDAKLYAANYLHEPSREPGEEEQDDEDRAHAAASGKYGVGP